MFVVYRAIAIGIVAFGSAMCAAAADQPALPSNPSRPSSSGGGLRLTVLQLDPVVKDLKLSDAQKRALEKISQEAREKRDEIKKLPREDRGAKLVDEMSDVELKIRSLLDAAQRARLDEAALQYELVEHGPTTLRGGRYRGPLKLTRDQVAALERLQGDRNAAVREARSAADNDAARSKVIRIVKSYNEKLNGVLTPDQRVQLDKMLGKEFDFGADVQPLVLTLGGTSPSLPPKAPSDP